MSSFNSHIPFFFIYLYLFIMSFHLSTTSEGSIEEIIGGPLRKIAIDILNETIINSSLTKECKTTLTESYLNSSNTSNFYLDKLLLDSSVSKNDITSYKPCMTYTHGYNISNEHITYLLTEVESNGLSSLYGICIVTGCEEDDYKDLANQTFRQIYHESEMNSNNDFFVIEINPNNEKFHWKWEYIIYLIPFFVICVFILLSFFNKFIVKLNIKHFRNLNNDTVQLNKIKSNAKKIFDTKANWIEVFEFNELVNEVNNNSGLTYTKSIRGISMLFLIFGLVLYYIYNSPLVILTDSSIYKLLSNNFYFIFYFGLRYSPKLLLSCSGFSLVYKLICYLDDNVESNSVMQLYAGKSKGNNDHISIQSHDDSLGQLIETNANERANKMEKVLSFKVPFRFIIKQAYKYLLLVLFILVINFSLYYVIGFLKNIEPMWEYFNQRIIKQYSKKDIVLSLSLISTFNIKSSHINVFSMFSFVYTEMICFIFTTIFIYFGYKKKFRIDSFLLFIIVGCFSIRFLYYLFNISNIPSVTYLSSFYFGHFEDTVVYNSVFYFLGAYFSLAYYSLQSSIVNYQDADNQQKPYLYIFVKLKRKLKKLNKVSAYVVGIVLLLMGIFLSFVQILCLKFFKGSEVFMLDINGKPREEATHFSFLNLYFLFDCEISTFVIHLSLFIFYSKGDNRFKKVFCHKIWNYFEKIYFSFILVTNPIVLYVIYECETRINFELSQILFYAVITFIVLFIVATVSYVLLELPFKRISKLLFARRTKSSKIITDKHFESIAGSLTKIDASSY